MYAEERLARREVVLWPGDEGLAVRHGGCTLSRYDVSFSPGAPRLEAVTRRAVRHEVPAPRLEFFALGEAGWLMAIGPDADAPRSRGKPEALWGMPFSYLGTL